MHSADFIPSRKEIYLFRGGNGREYLNDLHAFHVETFTWRVVESRGEIPMRRANHSSAFLVGREELFIFGGWYVKLMFVFVLLVHSYVCFFGLEFEVGVVIIDYVGGSCQINNGTVRIALTGIYITYPSILCSTLSPSCVHIHIPPPPKEW